MTEQELVKQWLQPGAIVPVDANTTRTLINALRERLARQEQDAGPHLFYAPGDVLICKESYERVVVKHGNTGPLQLANGKIALEWSDETYGEYTLEQIMDGFILEGSAPQEPSRAEKMREAGYTRRPSLREFPSDKPAREEQEPVQDDLIPPDSLFVCGQMGANVTRVRLAEPVQEPVACKTLCELCVKRGYTFCANAVKTTPINTPPRREWVGLTEEEIEAVDKTIDKFVPLSEGKRLYARAIETKLKEKNSA